MGKQYDAQYGEFMGKVIITKLKNRILLGLYEGRKPWMFETAAFPEEEGLLGNIYLARVKDVVPGMKGAFLSVTGEDVVYLPFKDKQELLCANRDISDAKELHQGDEIVVQIAGDALKTKQPTASADFDLVGQYCICSFFGHGIHFSKKLTKGKVDSISRFVKDVEIKGRKQYRFTIRTNVEALEDLSPLLQEMKAFIHIFDTIRETYRHRTCYSCLYRTQPEVVRILNNLSLSSYDEVVTDIDEIHDLLAEFSFPKPVRLYHDEQLSLSKLYSIETHLQEALSKRVWLPCGGYLIIEPTEAMVVIDVNSGKAESRGKKSGDYALHINLEAAREVARQLRLRNYSGMIMVDFINMESEEDKRILLKKLDEWLQEDKVRTRLVDMTALGIVEITRKKGSKPLSDFIHP